MNRRKSIKLLVSLSVGIAVGCDFKQENNTNQTSLLNPEDSIKKLVYLFGPWSVKQKNDAENFANRFIKSGLDVQPYLPKSDKLVQKLASRFPNKTMALNEVNLEELSIEEQELLLMLVKQLYNHIEIRYLASNQPQYGNCQSNPKGYTKNPKQASEREL